MKEIWKSIKGYDGVYEVSNFGRVRGLDRYVNYGYSDVLHKGQILKSRCHKNGYYAITLNNNGRKLKYIHRLVAEAFIPNPNNKKTVNHIDGNKANNCVTNLEWATQSENNLHAVYSLNYKRKPVGQYDKDNNLIKEYPSYKIAEKTTGISHISDACNGNRKSAGGYIWKWLPFKKMIGDIKAILEVIKDAYNA